MSEERKTIRGGFRATLALIIAIIALVFAIVAYNRTGSQVGLKAEIRDLKAKMEKMRKETTEKMGKIREDSKRALEKIGIDVKKQE
jgi:hypothetical protein